MYAETQRRRVFLYADTQIFLLYAETQKNYLVRRDAETQRNKFTVYTEKLKLCVSASLRTKKIIGYFLMESSSLLP